MLVKLNKTGCLFQQEHHLGSTLSLSHRDDVYSNAFTIEVCDITRDQHENQ